MRSRIQEARFQESVMFFRNFNSFWRGGVVPFVIYHYGCDDDDGGGGGGNGDNDDDGDDDYDISMILLIIIIT